MKVNGAKAFTKDEQGPCLSRYLQRTYPRRHLADKYACVAMKLFSRLQPVKVRCRNCIELTRRYLD